MLPKLYVTVALDKPRLYKDISNPIEIIKQ